MQKNQENKNRIIPNWGKWIVIVGVASLLFLLLSSIFSDNRMIYIAIQNYPENWETIYGIGDSYIKDDIIENFDYLESNANSKLENLLNSKFEKVTDSKIREQLADEESSFPFEISVFSSDVAKLHYQLNKQIRRLLKKEDVWVNLRITEFEDNLKAKIAITDWNDKTYFKQVTIKKLDYKNNVEKSINALFMDIAAYIYGIHHPLSSILHDYHIVNEYQGVSPWSEKLYSKEEKDSILLKYIHSNRPDSIVGYLLLGSINEKMDDEPTEILLSKLNNSILFYQTYLKLDTTFKDLITNKISIIENHINNLRSALEAPHKAHLNGINIIYNLEKKGLICLDSLTRQLIIVTDPISDKKEGNNGKQKIVRKAKMSLYEKNINDEWEQVLYEEPFEVNLGYNGIIPEKKKVEGDGCVPAGYFQIPLAFGFSTIDTKMKYKVIGEKDYWISNPQSRYYNTLQKESDKEFHDGMSERLANIELYEYAVVIGYNMNPIKKGKGSAIFIHVARSQDAVTAGCIAVAKDKLINIIKWLDSSKRPYIFIGEMPNL